MNPLNIIRILAGAMFLMTVSAAGGAGEAPICTGKPDKPCWQKVSNLPCHVWRHVWRNASSWEDVTVSWSGGCAEGKVEGKGREIWRGRLNGKSQTFTDEGTHVDGKRSGHWVLRNPEGWVSEGSFVDGKKSGHWVKRHADGRGAEGPYVDGKQSGRWVARAADGRVVEATFVDGRMSGQVSERHDESEAGLGLDRSARKRIQQALAARGFDPGPADGMFGPRTREAVREFQDVEGMEVTGFLNTAAVKRLLASASSGEGKGGQGGAGQAPSGSPHFAHVYTARKGGNP